MLGIAQALTTFFGGTIIAFLIYSASRRLHHVGSLCPESSFHLMFWKDAISRVMHSPMSFFETTVRIVEPAEFSPSDSHT
jgi:hypothetical protein